MLWRRYNQKEEAARETEGGQEEDAPGGFGGGASGGIHVGAQTGLKLTNTISEARYNFRG